MKFLKFDDVVRDICSSMGDDNASGYLRVARQLRRTLEMLNLTVYQTYETQEFEIGSNLTIKMPDETLEVQKVGIISEGQLVIMGYNNHIRRAAKITNDAATSCTCGGKTETIVVETVKTEDVLNSCPVCCFQNVSWNNCLYGEIYGIRPDRFPNGEYRWDRNTNLVEFGSGWDIKAGSKVWIEYKTALNTADYQEIPSEIYFCLLFFVQYILSVSTNPGAANFLMTEFRRHYNQLKVFYQRRNIEDYFGDVISNFSASVKR